MSDPASIDPLHQQSPHWSSDSAARARPLNVTADQFARVVHGSWRLVHSQCVSHSSATFVFQNDHDAGDVRVICRGRRLRNASRISVPGAGVFDTASYRDDPALVDLNPILEGAERTVVLRYRPGKRVTLLVHGADGEREIIKCVARGVEPIFDRLQRLDDVRETLPFRISRPLWMNASGTVFAQQQLMGQALLPEHLARSPRLAGQLAKASMALHASPAQLTDTFTTADQWLRSARYVDGMRTRFPVLIDELNRVTEELFALQERLDAAGRVRLCPIHGSLHTRQWLRTGDGLALVDFDRSAMGDPELDVATFLAEWDYEPIASSEPVKSAFSVHFVDADVSRVAFYRAHKHLAKAWKAARSAAPESLAKVQRNLMRLLWIVGSAEACEP